MSQSVTIRDSQHCNCVVAEAFQRSLWRLINPTNWPFCPCRPQLHTLLVLVEGRSLTKISDWLINNLYRRASGFTTRSDIGPAREGPSAEVIAYVNLTLIIPCLVHFLFSEAQERRGEEVTVDPEQFQDPDNEYGLFAGTTYEQDDEEADKIYDSVDDAMDSRRKARRCVNG